ncbi:MAG: TraR/DksA C4-type zinc finger protein [Thermanaeromonas sp.]|uniref:TraR/DksA C4-type zinc finger protein n=1 Tax=Thermanaeromonas sp. TaxID=2003697 RepID=UPI00243F5B47|nr:TraR/DksA C4-type zinc finger protein [Thermanaeromonas sp.]MCG0276964.1 TraR/DksA C4-type zinc finger protein [Thermanaeromonas sp.]
MEREKLEYFRRKLLALRASYEEQLDSIKRGGLAQSLRDSVEELSSYDNHPADLGSELFERSKDLALRDNIIIQLKKIEDALASIRQGTYGRCQECGREIPLERLEAAPESTLCLECRKVTEGLGERHPRPIEEDVIAPPFGGITHDTSPREQPDAEDEQEYDGEDAWQELAKTTEHASEAGVGAYYGPLDLDEDRGYVEPVDGIPYFKGADGMFYKDTGAYFDDEGAPRERVVGDEGWDKLED